MRKVLITGGAGFIGSHIADCLYKSGYFIKILDNLNPKTHNGEWPDYLNENYELVYGDVNCRDTLLSALKDVEFIIHMAAEMDLNPEFQKFINTNVGSTALIYELIQKNNLKIKKVLIASTQFVYGEGRWFCKKYGEFYPHSREISQLKDKKWEVIHPKSNLSSKYLKCKEDQTVNPPNHYALSKYFQEQFSLKIGKLYGIPTDCMRFSIVHGVRQSLKNTYSGALRTFSFFTHLDLPFSTFEDNLSRRDFISVYDAASAVKIILENNEKPYQIFNIAGDQSYSVLDLAKMVCKSFDKKIKFNNKIEFRRGDIRHAISCNSKIKALGWEPTYSEQDAIKEYVKWFKTQNLDTTKFLKTQKIIRENGQILSV